MNVINILNYGSKTPVNGARMSASGSSPGMPAQSQTYEPSPAMSASASTTSSTSSSTSTSTSRSNFTMPIPGGSNVIGPVCRNQFHIAEALLTLFFEPPRQQRAVLENANDRANRSPVKLPPIRSRPAKGTPSWDDEMAEVKQAADSLRSMYHDMAMDTSRADKDRRTALLTSAMHTDERGPTQKTAAFEALKTANKAAATRAKAAANAAKPPAGRKRKPDSSLDDDIAEYKQPLDHISTDDMHTDLNCDQVRTRINKVLDNAIMRKGEFCDAIGSSNAAVNNFLKKRGPMDGMGSDVYFNAWAWFKQREIAGLKMPDVKKRQKTEAMAAAAPATTGTSSSSSSSTAAAAAAARAAVLSSTPDISNIHLENEETDSVAVFDSADEIRRKIAGHLQTPGLTQAQFCRDLYAQLRMPKCSGIQTKQLNDFRGKKGARAGCTSSIFYAAYVYFEKLRIAAGKPKSVHRLKMEEIWAADGGFDREHDGRRG